MKTPQVLSALVLASCLVAQSSGTTFLPSLGQNWGNGCNTLPYGTLLYRWQQLYESSTLPAGLTTGKLITQIGWRRCGNTSTYNAATLDIEVGIYSVPFGQTGMNATFATNRTAGTGGVVFTRKLYNLPAMPLGSPASTFSMMPLDTMHTFAGPHLLVETVTFNATSGSTGWSADMCSGTTVGSAANFGAGCGPTTNTTNSTTANGTYLPGSTLTFSEASGPANAPAVHLLGFSASLLSGVIPLPFDLGSIGFANCKLYTSAEAQFPVTLDANGAGSVQLTVPSDSALSGLGFCTQWANLDSAAPNGLSTSMGRRYLLGPVNCPGAYLYRLSDNLDTSGTVFTNRGQVMRVVWL